jgi:hypothetical protein
VRTPGAILCTLLLSGFLALRCGATVYHSNGSVASVQALHNAALDGDTITIPAGTFSWTSRLNITKGITLQGATTITGAGTGNPRITDATIIKDNTPRRGSGVSGIIWAEMRSSQSFRLTGVTFAPGSSTQMPPGSAAIQLTSHDSAPCTKVRIDHCHFASLYQGKMIAIGGWVYGVADHNVITCRNTYSFLVMHGTYGGPSQYNGNGAWADYPWYGTGKFWFIEDNTITNGNIDSYFGGRWVARHNYLKNTLPSTHGTEGGSFRGVRAVEFYDNIVSWTLRFGGGGQRSGTSMWHDNTFIGREPNVWGMSNFRQSVIRTNPVWGFSDGTSPWDANDTEGNGTFVPGHPPFVFAGGSATSPTIIDGPIGSLRDSTKNWIPNQWIGYSVKAINPGSPSYPLGSYIIANTSNTIFYRYQPITAGTKYLKFSTGDKYQIHRVLIMMDQNGRGKTDQIIGTSRPVLQATGQPGWPHSALEPCYSWNNIHWSSGHSLGYFNAPGQPTSHSGIDYFNLGGGFPPNSTPSAVSNRYTAALNGVDYVGTFVYPHPLTALPIGTARAVVTDFNGEGSPDYVLQRASTHQTGIWYLDNNVYASSAFGPTLSAGWKVVAAADFNGDGKSDYLLRNVRTGQTGIYYLNNSVYAGSAYGPTLKPGWELAAAADFNGDSNPDYLLYNGNTRQTGIYYLNNNVYIGSAYGPTLPPGWTLVTAADFNSDGNPDYLLYNVKTRQTGIYYLDNNVYAGSAYGPALPAVWTLVGAADFNGDSKPDYLLYDVNTQQTGIYYLNNNVYISSAWGPTVSGWSLFGP